MADDLSSFIEQQKIKLEKERADLSRNGNYTSTALRDKGVGEIGLPYCKKRMFASIVFGDQMKIIL